MTTGDVSRLRVAADAVEACSGTGVQLKSKPQGAPSLGLRSRQRSSDMYSLVIALPPRPRVRTVRHFNKACADDPNAPY